MTEIMRKSFEMATAIAILLTIIERAGATCNSEQKNRCRRSAEEGHLDTIPGSGQCMLKQYVQFTHVCTVLNYVPSIDHCCCSLRPTQVMCCRYHQDWHHFRCVESDDTIDTSSQTTSVSSLPWEQLLLVALAVVVTGGCIILCCITSLCRHCRRLNYEYDEDNNKYSVYSCCDDGTEDFRENKSNSVNINGCLMANPVVRQSAAATAVVVQSTSTSCPVYRHRNHHQINCYADRPPPSAPPSSALASSGNDQDLLLQPTSPPARTLYRPLQHQLLNGVQQVCNGLVVSVDEHGCRPRCSACAIVTSFPPPTYDESLFHCLPAATTVDGGPIKWTGSVGSVTPSTPTNDDII